METLAFDFCYLTFTLDEYILFHKQPWRMFCKVGFVVKNIFKNFKR